MEKKTVVALDRSGNVGVNASVRVTEYPGGALATIYSDDGETPKGNPFLTNENGSGFFYAANARYTIEITGGGLDGIVREDVLLFDPADGAFESTQVAGLGDLNGQVEFDVLVSDGDKFQRVPLEGSIFDALYAKVNDVTEGYVHTQSNRAGTAAPLEVDNLGAGRLAVFRQDGTDKAWITNGGGAEFTGDVVFQGNITVNGTQTILNTETLEVEDNIIVLNAGVTGTPTLDAGIEIERGDLANVSLLWDESAGRWTWTADGATYHVLPGLGVADTWTAKQTFSGGIDLSGSEVSSPRIKDYAEVMFDHGSVSGATGCDLDNGNVQAMTLTGNATLSVTNWPASGVHAKLTLYIAQDATGGRTVTWPAAVRWAGGAAAPDLSAADEVDVIVLTSYDGGTTIFGFVSGQGF